MTGMLVQRSGAWQLIGRDEIVDRTRLSRNPTAIFPGKTEREEGWTLFEGSRIVQRPSFERPTRLLDLGSRGWPLFLSDHQFNRASAAKQLKSFGAVVDHGVVSDGRQLAGSKQICLDLLDPIEPDTDHHIAIWTEAGRVANIAVENISVEGSRWTVDPEIAGIDPHDSVNAAAIAFRGTRLGSWWLGEWWRALLSVEDEDSAESAASCLRWFRLPLILRARPIRQKAKRFGMAFFKKWVLNSELFEQGCHRRTEQFLPDDLMKQEESEVGWPETTRVLLKGLQIPSKEIGTFCPEPLASKNGFSLQSLVEQLTTWNPLLAAQSVNAWVEGQPNKSEEILLRRFLADYVTNPLKRRRDEMAESNGGDFGSRDPRVPWLALSDTFVNGLIATAQARVRGKADPANEENLETALNKADLCRLLAAALILLGQAAVPVVATTK